MSTIILDGETLTCEKVFEFGYNEKIQIKVDTKVKDKIDKSRDFVDGILKSGETRYGINTGFGHFSNVKISKEDIDKLQLNLIRSHCCGVGEPISVARARMVMLLRINTLLKGFSGIRFEVIETYIKAVNLNLIPYVPEKGTVGASGDLAPLSHIALGLIGEGKVFNPKTKKYEDGDKVLKEFGLEPIQLKAKEGLALINGTQFMTALGCEGLVRAERLIRQGDVVAALSLEALHGSFKAFDERIHKTRPHSGQLHVAKRMRQLFTCGESEINQSHKDCKMVQDAYTLRCIPQVHGVIYDTIEFVKSILEVEINSATDNPMVFDNDIVSGGNFHGEYPAKACDYLTIAIAELGNISERRTARMIDNQLSSHLPGFLVEKGGLNSGFMMAQVTAASLASENKVLCHPSSSDTIPTSASKEDHVSMGGFSARKLLSVVDNVEYIVAIELLCSAQAFSFSYPLKSTKPLENLYSNIRKEVPIYKEDRNISKDMEIAKEFIMKEKVWESVKEFIENDEKK